MRGWVNEDGSVSGPGLFAMAMAMATALPGVAEERATEQRVCAPLWSSRRRGGRTGITGHRTGLVVACAGSRRSVSRSAITGVYDSRQFKLPLPDTVNRGHRRIAPSDC